MALPKLRKHALWFVCIPILIHCHTPAHKSTPSGTAKHEHIHLPYTADQTGIVLSPKSGEAKTLRLQVWGDNMVRITSSPTETLPEIDSIMVSRKQTPVPFQHEFDGDSIHLSTRQLNLKIDIQSGTVKALARNGSVIWETSDSGQFEAVTEDPAPPEGQRYAVRQEFSKDAGEAFFGLGQQQNGLVNYAEHTVELTTHNLEIAVPLLISSKRYGLLWDNNSISQFGNQNARQPLFEDFELYDAAGNPGGLTAYYYDGDRLLTSRVEKDTNYQYLTQGTYREYPLPAKAQTAKNLRIELHGSLAAKAPGTHTLSAYSSGALKVYVDNKLLLDRWRMNWNPWYHNADVDFKLGERKPIKVYWTPEGGYLRLLQQAPADPALEGTTGLSSETAKAIDYYYIQGNNVDDVIGGYRKLTGKASMLPKWAFGFWQSRERYQSQQELIETFEQFREEGIPIDNIVLDWFYWPENAWGSHDFDPAAFPDPKAMVDRIHQLNGNIMISVWPKFYPSTEHYKAMEKNGWLFLKNVEEQNRDWVGPGYLNAFYDAFNPKAAELYWQQIDEKLNSLGFDAWWLDATEPDMHSNLSVLKRKQMLSPNARGSGAENFNAYAVPHAEAVYRGALESQPDKRPFILTRSGFAGIQRNGAAVWSGDTVSRWSNLREQVAAGIGMGLSGVPYWTTDIGGFTPPDEFRFGKDGKPILRWSDMKKSQLSDWQELNTRWFQFGVFSPLFRSHGQSPYREIFHLAKKRTDAYRNLIWQTKLRYHLMPYIYTAAGDTYHHDSTMMRGLVMDFPNDPAVKDITDQYLFGPSLLIAPVTEKGARSRNVYLPSGTDWVDFYTGERHKGGQAIFARAPLSRIPVFVKAGAIVPTGPAIEHVFDKPNGPVTINLFFGDDGYYELYEDDGTSLEYETGGWSRIPIEFNNSKRLLTIGKRIGTFNENQRSRNFKIRWIKGRGDSITEFGHPADAEITYRGEEIKIQL